MLADESGPVRTSTAHRSAALYFAVQSVAIVAWWIALAAQPGLRARFFPEEVLAVSLAAWFGSDMVVVVLPSILASVFAYAGKRGAPYAAFAACGGLINATTHCLSWVFTSQMWLPVVFMVPATIMTCAASYALTRLD